MSNRDVVEVNRDELKKIFNRPIDVIHNVTDSFIMDIFKIIKVSYNILIYLLIFHKKTFY